MRKEAFKAKKKQRRNDAIVLIVWRALPGIKAAVAARRCRLLLEVIALMREQRYKLAPWTEPLAINEIDESEAFFPVIVGISRKIE